MTLNNALLNKEYEVCQINTNLDVKKRLEDLGLIKGMIITPLYKSILNDPVSYLIKGSVIVLRNEDTKKIIVKKRDDYNGIN